MEDDSRMRRRHPSKVTSMSNCNHDVIAWRDENGEALLWGCYKCRIKFVPMTQLVDAVLEEREACALVCINIANKPSNVVLGVAINCADAIRARGQA
jgi:hypothetical protein